MPNPIDIDTLLSTPSPRLIEDIRQLKGDLLILGLGGKMGPSLAKLALNAYKEAGHPGKILGASRFSNRQLQDEMERIGVTTFRGDLLDPSFLQQLPEVENIIYMAGQKFGTKGNESTTWAMNSYLPGLVANKYHRSRIVAFSTGNVYPFVPVDGTGATEETPVEPVGEYAQSCLGRERIFQYFSEKHETPVVLFRLNYALDLRYGVLNDIAQAVWSNNPIDLSMGFANVIWQGDANEFAIRSLLHARSPAMPLNITGSEKIMIREVATRFGKAFDRQPVFIGLPQDTALLSDASKSFELFGMPSVSLEEMLEMTINWVLEGGVQINKPTHFQERKGKF